MNSWLLGFTLNEDPASASCLPCWLPGPAPWTYIICNMPTAQRPRNALELFYWVHFLSWISSFFFFLNKMTYLLEIPKEVPFFPDNRPRKSVFFSWASFLPAGNSYLVASMILPASSVLWVIPSAQPSGIGEKGQAMVVWNGLWLATGWGGPCHRQLDLVRPSGCLASIVWNAGYRQEPKPWQEYVEYRKNTNAFRSVL